jgi:hypothetical protein
MDYAWVLRTDGKGLLDSSNPAVSSGSVTGATKIAFGGFSIPWAMCGRGSGWVYYAATPLTSKQKTSFEMCPTTETNLSLLDGLDPQWRFRKSPPMDWKLFFGDGIDRGLIPR